MNIAQKMLQNCPQIPIVLDFSDVFDSCKNGWIPRKTGG